MNLNQLNYFLVLARVGSYSEAAFQLDIAQSTLSQSMLNLEREFGTPLFYAEKRVTYLTGAGAVFQDEAKKILQDVAQSKEKVAQYLNGNIGNVTIGVSGSFGVNIVPKAIRRYRQFHPENLVNFSIIQGNTEQILQGIRDHDVDFGICSYSRHNEDIEFSLIEREPYVVITSRWHELAEREQILISEILKYPLITFSTQSAVYYDIARMLNVDMTKLDIVMQVDDSSMMVSLVESGIGIAVIPRIYVLDNFDVKVLNLEDQRYRDIFCAYLKYQILSPVAKEFRSLIQLSSIRNSKG